MRSVFLKMRKFERKTRNSLIKIKPLNYIKNKYKLLTAEELERSIDVYKRINKFMKVEYQESLSYFYCEN